jgi:pimeloyl-ACP methyl ester carboxylesterase
MRRTVGLVSIGLATLAGVAAFGLPPGWGAAALTKQSRRPSVVRPESIGLASEPFAVEVADGVRLRGWLVRATGPARGLLVYFHGAGDNKDAAVGMAARFAPLGYDVAAYDARAHGDSTGDLCTYGAIEKHDLGRVLDTLAIRGAAVGRTLLLGHSMGAAVALQAAAVEPRVRAVVAVSPFSDLRAAARGIAPFFVSDWSLDASLRRAESLAHFRVGDASPVEAVRTLEIPILLIHGEHDTKLPPDHSRRILAAARHAKMLLLPAGHDDVLAGDGIWEAIRVFLEAPGA